MKSYGISDLRAARLALIAAIVAIESGCREAVLDGDGDGAVSIGILAAVDETGHLVASHVNAARLAVERVNQSGGLLLEGHHRLVELHVAPAHDKKGALASALDLVNRRRVAALIGPFALEPALPVATLAEAGGVPMIVVAETVAGPARGSFVFRATPSDAQQGLTLARWITEELQGKRVSVVYDASSPGSAAVAKSFRVGTAGFDGTLTGIELADLTPSRLDETLPDAVVLLVEPHAGVKLAREARLAGIGAEIVAIDMGTAASFPFGELDRVHVAGAWHPAIPTDASRAFADAFTARYATPPLANDALTYDAVGLMLEAMARAGTIAPDAVRQSLRGLTDYRGATGVFSFDGGGTPTKALPLLEVRDGEVTFRRWLTPFGS